MLTFENHHFFKTSYSNRNMPKIHYGVKDPKRRQLLKLEVFKKTDGHCAYCGCDISNGRFEIDHVVPRRKYKTYGGDCYDPKWEYGEGSGSNELHNLLPCCQSCNCSKSDLTLEQFRNRVVDRLARLNEYSSEYQIAKRFGLVKEQNIDVVFYFEKLTALQNG